MGKVRLTAALAAIAATLAMATPAMADDPPSDTTLVGPGQVITDPASETEPTPPEDVAEIEDTSGTVTQVPAEDPTPKRGEIHVLGTGPTTSSPAPSPASAAVPAPAPRTTAARTGRSSAKTLPFTGVNAGLLALCGAALLGSGLLVRRRVA